MPDEGTLPVTIAFDDLPDIPYDNVYAVGLGLTYSLNVRGTTDSEALIIDTDNLQPNAYVFQPALYYPKATGNIELFISTDRATVNAESMVIDNTSSAWPAANSYVRLSGISRRVGIKPKPQTRVYKFELEVAGTAGAQPAITQFYITASGATGGDRTTSKLLVSQTDFQRWEGTATLTDVISAGATTPTSLLTDRWDTTKFFGSQFFTNGTDDVYSYPDGSDEVEDSTAIKAGTISAFVGRMFYGETTETGSYFQDRVRWSVIRDATDLTGAGSGFVDLDDTMGKVVKLLPLGGVLVGYKQTSLYNLNPTGDVDDAIVKQLVSPGIGCAAKSTVLSVVARDGLPAHIFLGQGRGGYNVYMYTGTLLEPIGDDIKQELRDNIDPLQAKNAFAIVDHKRNQYIFFVAYRGETFPHRAWLYDIDTGSWKHWRLPETTAAGLWETDEETDSIQEWTLLLGQPNGKVFWLDPDSYQDEDGTNLLTTVESGDYAVDPRVRYATVYRVHLRHYDVAYTPVRVSVSTDGGETYQYERQVFLGQSDGSADSSLQLAFADLIVTGRRFRVKIEHDDDNPIEISEIILELKDQGWIA
jgi:hypothetical protein